MHYLLQYYMVKKEGLMLAYWKQQNHNTHKHEYTQRAAAVRAAVIPSHHTHFTPC